MKLQMQNTFIAQLLEDSTPAADPGAGGQAQASVPLAIEKATERPPLGSIARPVVARGDGMPLFCLWATCDGCLSGQGGNLYFCSDCRTWFELKPLDLGVYVGDLADSLSVV